MDDRFVVNDWSMMDDRGVMDDRSMMVDNGLNVLNWSDYRLNNGLAVVIRAALVGDG